MLNILINETGFEHLIKTLETFKWTSEDSNKREEIRRQFVSEYNQERINNLTKEDYFAGLGRKEGCMAYDLEWKTRILGSIKGGSKYKFGYENDFPNIKEIIKKIPSIDSENVYQSDGNISKELIEIVNLSKKINGFKTGRTVIPKLLSLYYPDTFLPIFNDQEHYLSKLLSGGLETEKTGLELYLENNYKLVTIKKKLEEVTNKTFQKYEFIELLYCAFPKEQIKMDNKDALSSDSEFEQEFEALEVQHYQSLLHRNFNRLFPNLKYFDEEEQRVRNGQYDTQTVGIIDILAIDEKNNFKVIEIKRKANDQTLGQILRYMGWVKEELCKDGQKVDGIIIGERKDLQLEFALKVVPNVKFIKLNLNITLEEE